MADMSTVIDGLLKKHGITGAKMCQDLNMSKSFMTELRKGRAKSIKIETAQKIADYFNVSVGYLLGTEEEKKPTVSGEQKETPDELQLTEGESVMLNLFRQFPEIQQDYIVSMMQNFYNVPEDKRGSALETFQALLKML